MTLLVFQLKPGVTGGTVNQGGGVLFNIGAAIASGGGSFTVDSQVSPQLAAALLASSSVYVSGSTPGVPVVQDVVAPMFAHSVPAGAAGYVPVQNADGTFDLGTASSQLAVVAPANGSQLLAVGAISVFDLSLGSVLGTFPSGPQDRAQVGVRISNAGFDSSSNAIPCIVICGTGDRFADRSLTFTMTAAGMLIVWQYDAPSDTWAVCGGYTPPGSQSSVSTFQVPVTAPSINIAPLAGQSPGLQIRGIGFLGGAPAFVPADGSGWSQWDIWLDPTSTGPYWVCSDPLANGGNAAWFNPSTPVKPTVAALPAAAQTSTSFAVSATVMPNGQAATYQFQVGTANGGPYATQVLPAAFTTVGSPGNDLNTYTVAATFTGLTAGGTYYVICQARNATGTVSSAQQTVLLPATPTAPTVTGENYTSATTTSFQVQAFVNANGGTGCTWQAQYSTNGGTSWLNVGSVVALGSTGYNNVFVSQTVTGLTGGTAYAYRVTATNSVGGPVNGATQSMTTLAAGLPPAVVTGAASSVTQTSATIAGTCNPQGYLTNVQFVYGTSPTLVGATQSAAQSAGSGTSAATFTLNLTGLAAGTTIYYQIVASSVNGAPAGTIQSFSTLTAGTVPTNTTLPVISGSATVGGTLSTTDGAWSGTTPITYAQQWLQSGNPIIGQTGLTYSPVTGDIGQAISCRVTASNSIGTVTATSRTVTVAGSSGSIVSGGLLDFSDIAVSAGSPIINPKITQSPFQNGAFNTALNSATAAACQVLYNMQDMPGLGLPKHARIITPALRMTANAGDGSQAGAPTYPYGGVHQPGTYVSSSFNSPVVFAAGNTYYIGFSLMVDPSQPVMSGNQFQQFMEIFGSTVFGSPPIDMGIIGAGTAIPAAPVESFNLGVMGVASGGAGTGHWPWTSPVVRGSWIDFVLCINFNVAGTLQLWMNGVAQTFNKGNPASGMTGWGTTTIGFNTLNGNGSGGSNSNTLIIDNYRTAAWCTQSRMWNCGTKVGTSYSAVAP